MIARSWHGMTPAEKADSYVEVVTRTGVEALRATPGNQGVYLLRRTEGDRAHFLVVSLWESFEAIKRFAGEEYENAVYYPEDEGYLLEFEPHVTHYEVSAHEA